MKHVLAVLSLCVAAALVGCGGSSSNDNPPPLSSNLHLQLDDGATLYASGDAIDMGSFTETDYMGSSKLHTLKLINDGDPAVTVALGGIEFVSGEIGDGTTTRLTFNEWYSNVLGYVDLPDVSALTDATFATADSASFDLDFFNGFFQDGNYRKPDGTWDYGYKHPLWHVRYKYSIKLTDDQGAADDFLFEVYGVASC
jgi:hypothetical protein